MPVVTFEAAQLTRAQKQELVGDFTESAARITGLPKESIFVFLKENCPENVGVGGVLLDDRKKRAAGYTQHQKDFSLWVG